MVVLEWSMEGKLGLLVVAVAVATVEVIVVVAVEWLVGRLQEEEQENLLEELLEEIQLELVGNLVVLESSMEEALQLVVVPLSRSCHQREVRIEVEEIVGVGVVGVASEEDCLLSSVRGSIRASVRRFRCYHLAPLVASKARSWLVDPQDCRTEESVRALRLQKIPEERRKRRVVLPFGLRDSVATCCLSSLFNTRDLGAPK